MEVAGKIIELFGVVPRTKFTSLRVNWWSESSPRPTLWRETSKWRFHRIHGICSDMQLKLRANMPTERRRHDASLLRKKRKKHRPSIVEAVWPFTSYRHGIIVIICNILVLNVGNFREWSIITSNHPSNPQQPIHSLRKTHQEVTCCGQELSEHHLGALGWSSR